MGARSVPEERCCFTFRTDVCRKSPRLTGRRDDWAGFLPSARVRERVFAAESVRETTLDRASTASSVGSDSFKGSLEARGDHGIPIVDISLLGRISLEVVQLIGPHEGRTGGLFPAT